MSKHDQISAILKQIEDDGFRGYGTLIDPETDREYAFIVGMNTLEVIGQMTIRMEKEKNKILFPPMPQGGGKKIQVVPAQITPINQH